jgi:predicted RNA-binding protein associated with RNAse of E/G family
MKEIGLIYKRLPDRISFFRQKFIYEDETVIVTQQQVKPSAPLVIDGVTVLADNYTALWFIFPDKWYDMGKMYNPQGECTGYYCDIIMPIQRTISQDKPFLFTVEITDLCLDLWICSDGSYHILDEDEFELALKNGWMDDTVARKARQELNNLTQLVKTGKFPPSIVETIKVDLWR